MTFQAWNMILLNSVTFQEEWSPCFVCVCNVIKLCSVQQKTTAVNIADVFWHTINTEIRKQVYGCLVFNANLNL